MDPLRRSALVVLATLSAGLAACTGVTPFLAARLPPASVTDGISGPELRRHIARLASTEFAGRAPGTRGEVLTVDYLVAELKAAGAKPGNPDGTYLQDVPLIGIASVPSA